MLSDAPIQPGDLVTRCDLPVVCGVGRVLRMQTVKVRDVPTEFLLLDLGGPVPVTRECVSYRKFIPWQERPRGLGRAL